MTKFEEWWNSLSNIDRNTLKVFQLLIKKGFEAGYNTARNEDITTVCYMCAQPEQYKPAQPIEGSLRLFHFVGTNNWNAGQCLAQPLLAIDK